MLTNFHTHTYRCQHATGTEEDYVKEAIQQGIEILGFSDHGPFPDKDFGLRMKYDELKEYVSEIERLQLKYKNNIKLLKGLEIEYHPQYIEYYKDLLNNQGIDYLVLGEHQYTTSDRKLHNIFFASSTKDYIEYSQAVCEAMRTKLFSFVAHPDIMFINDKLWDTNCETACNLIIDCAEKTDTPLEFNANGLRRNKQPYIDGFRYPYPYDIFWEKVKNRKIRVIVNSDNHTPQQVNDDSVKSARETVKNMNLNVVDKF